MLSTTSTFGISACALTTLWNASINDNDNNHSKARELLKDKAITNFDDHGHFIDHQALAEADPNRTWSIYHGGWVGGWIE